MSFGEKLKEARKNKKISQEKLAKLIGVSRGAIANYEAGNNTPTFENMEKIIELLSINIVGRREVKEVPIVGTASCGGSEINFLQVEGMSCIINAEKWNEHLYCVIANGDSMATDIEDGDEIICDPNAQVQNGDIVHYSLENESAIKIYNKDDDNYMIEFIPYNQSETFKTKVVRLDSEEIDNLKVSKVVAINKNKLNNRLARLKLVGRA